MIQCDNTNCWCVDNQFGNEIEGTRVPASQIINCNSLILFLYFKNLYN